MAIDYDTWKTEPPEEEPEIETCPICEIDFVDCEHDSDDVQEWYDQEKAEYLVEKEDEINSAIDLDGEINW